ncbi:MAG: hypothetical protein NC541_03835 [bacterium]|nr:hypothetical protein [bacterium]MCM1500049.1 hypothetical protein [Clostridium sp.]
MEHTENIRKRNKIIDITAFVVMLVIVSAVMLILFYRQTCGNDEEYASDMAAYIQEMQGLDSRYSFPYPIFFKFAAMIHLFASPELAVAIATMLLNSLAILVTKLIFNRLILTELENGLKAFSKRSDISWMAGIAVSLISVSLFFVSMLYPPEGIYLPGIRFKYVGVFSPNPFHNATYLAARPFAILAFLWYIKLLPLYEMGTKKNGRLPDYFLFSFFLLIATMTKPSFTLVLVSAAGLLMLYRLVRARFRNFIPTVQLGLCFIPTFLDLLYQYRGVFYGGDGAERGIGFCFGYVWALYCDSIPLAVGLVIAFPLSVLILNYKECGKSTLFRFSWLLYLMSFLEAFFLYEKGFRMVDFNFSWGYMYGIFFCHFGALLVLLRVTAKRFYGGKNSGAKREKMDKIFIALQWLLYAYHVVCGIAYFMNIFAGETYY